MSNLQPHRSHGRLAPRSMPDHSNQASPGSIPLSPTDILPRTLEMDLSKSRVLPLSTLDSESNSSRQTPTAFDEPIRTTLWPPAYNLYNFYQAPRNAGPWVPPGLVPENQQGRQRPGQSASRMPMPQSFSGWRSTAPSECDTLPTGHVPSDSGYESRSKYSIENLSIFDGMDRSQDTQSITGRMTDLQPFTTALPSETLTRGAGGQGEGWPNPSEPSPVGLSRDPYQNKLVCPTCHKAVKTNSELVKHDARHNKPYKCDVAGCAREGGFISTNDLERHRASKHPELGTSKPRYRCPFDQCQTKVKFWPRADNFRSHLKRVHRMDYTSEHDITRYIASASPPVPEVPPYNHDNLEGVGSAMELNFTETEPLMNQSFWMDPRSQSSPRFPCQPSQSQVELDLPETDTMPSEPAFLDQDRSDNQSQSVIDPQLGESQFETAAQLSPDSPVGIAEDGVVKSRESSRRVDSPRPSHEKKHEEGVNGNDSIPESESTKEASESEESDEDNDTSSQTSAESNQGDLAAGDVMHSGSFENAKLAQQDRQVPSKQRVSVGPLDELDDRAMMDLLQKVPKGLLEKFMRENGDQRSGKSPWPSPSRTESALHTCSSCPKSFLRKCELKKHQRRHERPYACTFSGCMKKFGSKNDWKRHENSQHFQLEVWKCHEKIAESGDQSCGKVFPRREQFKHHLQTTHEITDGDRIDNQLSSCRVGRHCENRFWCGFCTEIIEIARKGVHAWTERFNHIDDHICGRNDLPKKAMSEWQGVDPDSSSSGLPKLDPQMAAVEVAQTQSLGSSNVLKRKDSAGLDVDEPPSSKTKRPKELDQENDLHQAKKAKHDGENEILWICCNCMTHNSVDDGPNCFSKGGCTHGKCLNCTLVEGKRGTYYDKEGDVDQDTLDHEI